MKLTTSIEYEWYGCMGTKYFRFFDVRLAEAITLEGQLSIKYVQSNVNKHLNSLLKTDNKDFVLGIDTDSVLLSLEELVIRSIPEVKDSKKIANFLIKVAENKLQPYVDSVTSELSDYVNSYSNKIFFKLEKICSAGIWSGAKKRYALMVYSNEGVIYSEPKLKVTGLEVVQSSTPNIIKKALKDCLYIFLCGSENELIDYVSNFKKEFKTYSVEKISFPQGVNGLEKYHDEDLIYSKGTPIQVRAALLYNKNLKAKNLDKEYEAIKSGDKIKYVYLKVPNPIKENVIGFPENLPKQFDLEEFIDYNIMYEKGFIKPLSPLATAAKWKLEKTNTLDDFF